MLALAEAKSRREHPTRFVIGKTAFRLSGTEPPSLNGWFGVIRYHRSYARPIEGGVGHSPLDQELGLLGDRVSPNLLSVGARLASRTRFAEGPPSSPTVSETPSENGVTKEAPKEPT